jgi:hypothetical protein
MMPAKPGGTVTDATTKVSSFAQRGAKCSPNFLRLDKSKVLAKFALSVEANSQWSPFAQEPGLPLSHSWEVNI